MTNQFKEIGLRLQGLREALEMSQEKFAKSCSISIDQYKRYEEGEEDLTINVVRKIANRHDIDVSVLMFDDEPRMSSYFLTRKGKGMTVKRMDKYQYKYQSLAGGFNNRKADIFEVTVSPMNVDSELIMSSHEGQEFALVIEGKMQIHVDGKDLILEEGDSIYFDSRKNHCMKALDNKELRFIAIIL